MAEKTYDIEKYGSAPYRKLQEINNLQEENDSEDNFSIDVDNPDVPPTSKDFTSQDYIDQQSKRIDERLGYVNKMSNKNLKDLGWTSGDISEYFNSDKTSRFDKRVTDYTQYLNIENVRGQQQSGVQQLMSGLGKMAVIAGTTAADSFAGTVAGIANIVGQAVQGNISKEHWASDVLNAGIENPVSKWLIGINDRAEEWMPNYYTEEEKNTPWYQQFWHANFIGDHFLKNTGFMLGAMLAGKATAGVVSKLTKLGEARNLFKNTALAAGMEDKTAKEVLNMYKQGKAIGSEQKVSQALADAAKNARKAELELKLISSASGSFGESRMEAITNSNDWFEKTKNTLDQRRAEQIQNLDSEIMSEHPEMFAQQPIVDEYGQIVGYQPVVADEQAYNGEYNRRMEAIEQKYNDALAQATKHRIDYSNASFGINFALTWGENFQLFGDALIGSYSKRSIFNRKVRQAAAKDAAGKVAWEANLLQYAKDITKGIASPIFEGTQEMWQQATTLGLNRRAGSKINDYYGDVIDPDGLEAGVTWVSNFVDALGATYGDAEQWENFAMGFLTALLPILGVVKSTSTNNTREDVEAGRNKPKSKVVFGGEFWESMREAKANKKESQALADALNDLEKDDRKRQMLFDIIRYNKSNERQQAALDAGDEKSYKDEEASKLATMIMSYSDAGQIDYLKQLVDEMYTVETPEQVEAIRRNTIYRQKQGDKEVELSVFDGMSDQEVIDYFNKQKDILLNGTVDQETGERKPGKIDLYHQIYQDLNKVYGDFGGMENSDAYRKQLAFDIMSITDREDRIKQTSSEVLNDFRQYAEQFKAGILNYELTDEQKKELDDVENAMKALDDITKLNIALGNDGFLDKLDKVRQNQKMTLNEKLQHVNDMIESEQRLLDKRIRQEKKRSDVRRRLVDYYDYLGFVKEKLEKVNSSVETTTKNMGISNKIDDLLDLLGEREGLYNQLAVLSGVGGAELFMEGLSMDMAVMMDEYHERYSQKYYDAFKDSHDIDDLQPEVIGTVRHIARRQKDSNTERYLDSYEKYIYGDNSLLNTLPEKYGNYYNFLYAGLKQVISSNEDPEKLQDEILTFFRQNVQDEDLLKEIEKFESNIKKAQERKEDTDSGISGNGKPVEQKPEDDDDEYGVFSEEDFDFQRTFRTGNDMFTRNFLKAFCEQESNKKLVQKLAERLGYSEDETESMEEYVNSIAQNHLDQVVDELENLYNEYLQSDKTGTKQEGQEGGENAEQEEGQENEEEGSAEENTNPETSQQQDQDGSETFTMEDSNTDTDDNVSAIHEAGDKILTVNDKKPTIDPKQSNDQIRLDAENTIDDNYVDGQGNDLFTDETAKVPDVWNVNRSSLYDYGKLRDRRLRKLAKYVDMSGRLNPSSFTKWLNDEYKVQEFIDSGFLAKVAEAGSKTVRFVGVNDPDFLDARLRNNKNVQYKLNETLFAAIEIPSELKQQYSDAGFKLIDFKDENGNTIQMQILGVVMPQPQKGGKDKYLNGNKYKDGAFQSLIDSVYNERQRIFRKNGKDTKFLAYGQTSEIDYIFPGRFVKQTETTSYGERFISEILTDEERENPEGKLQLALYIKNDDSIKIGRTLDGEEVPLNTFSFESEAARRSGRNRAGSVWILTREADGKVYHKGARLLDFDERFYGKYSGSSTNPYMNGIRDAVRKIARAKTKDEIYDALHEIQKYLYFSDGHDMLIKKSKSGQMFLIINNGKEKSTSINLQQTNAEAVIMKTIVGKKYKFSIGDTTLKEVIDSNIIYTDLAELHNKNASFTIKKVVDGKPVDPNSDYNARTMVNEETDMESDSRNGNVYDIAQGNQKRRYKVFYKQNEVRYVSTDKPVTDPKEKAIALKCFELESSGREIKSDIQALQNTNGASAQKTIHVVKYTDASGQPSTAAFIYSKYNKKVNVIVLEGAEANLAIKIATEGYKPDSSDDQVLNNIKSLLGLSKNGKIKKAVENGTGVKEPTKPVKTETVVPNYVRQHPELKGFYFKEGDIITGNDMFDDFEGVVQKVYEDGRIDVLFTNRNVGVIQISPSAVTNFFGLTNNTDTDIEILTKTNTDENSTWGNTTTISHDQFKKKQEDVSGKTEEQKGNDIVNKGKDVNQQFKFTNDAAKKFYQKLNKTDFSTKQNSRIEQAKLIIGQHIGEGQAITWNRLKQIINDQDENKITELNRLLDGCLDKSISKQQREENFETFAKALESLKC